MTFTEENITFEHMLDYAFAKLSPTDDDAMDIFLENNSFYAEMMEDILIFCIENKMSRQEVEAYVSKQDAIFWDKVYQKIVSNNKLIKQYKIKQYNKYNDTSLRIAKINKKHPKSKKRFRRNPLHDSFLSPSYITPSVAMRSSHSNELTNQRLAATVKIQEHTNKLTLEVDKTVLHPLDLIIENNINMTMIKKTFQHSPYEIDIPDLDIGLYYVVAKIENKKKFASEFLIEPSSMNP